MSPARHRTPSEPLVDREQVLRDLRSHRQVTRVFLAQFAAARAQIDAAETAVWSAWLVQPSTASATGARAGLQRLAADAIARQLDASAASAIAGQDPLVHQLSQSGREALQQPTGSDAAQQVQARLAALDAESRDLLLGHYRDRQTNADQAQRLGWSPARVDARLVSARASVDWTSASSAEAESEGLVPTLIEDHLAGTIDADSRALLIKRLIDDLQFASRLERQARMDLVLGEVLAAVDEAANEALADRLLSRDHGGPAPRSQQADDRRSAALPVVRRRKSVPIPMIGGVIAGAAALIAVLVLMAGPTSGNRTSDKSPASNTPPANDRPTVTTPPRSAPATVAVPALATPLATPLAASIPTSPITAPAIVAQPIPVAPPSDPVTTPTAPVAAPTPAPIASAPTKPATTPAAITAKPVFVKGIHFGGDAVTIDGNRWQSQKQAEGDGLTLKNARRVMVTMTPVPAVDAETRALLISGITTAKSEPLGIGLTLPDGDYEVTAWMMENQRANSRLFDLDVGGVALANLGDLPLGGWATYGPCTVTVRGGRLDIAAKARRGTPLVMGLTIHRTAASIAADAKSYVADFSAGVAKDWTPLGGAWSVADGHYRHTSAENVELSVYDGASWGDVAYSAAMHPHYDNGYGLVFGALDAQTYDAVYIVKSTASLLRVVKGAKTEIAQAACLGTGLFKWSEVAVTRSGRTVSVTINGAAVFSEVDLGEPTSGKIGLFTSWNPVDFAKIKVSLPKR